MRSKAWAAILAVILLFSLSGCEPKITEGEVVEKEFSPEHTQRVMVPVVHSNGKTSFTTYVPYFYHYSDKWTITIEGCTEEGETVQETFRVTKEVYDAVEIGFEFVYQEDMEPEEPEYTREKQAGEDAW